MKKLLFVTGTRADFGKIKSLIHIAEESKKFVVYVYVTGMHLLEQFGSTYREVEKEGFQNVYVAHGTKVTDNMAYNVGVTVTALTGYIKNIKPDMIVIHGDRTDALAGAIVGAYNNILVAHIEGGEVSGTIDESTRHAISKFSHLHFVCNDEARKRLIQMGEEKKRVYVLGSPDIDIMLSDNLPTLDEAKKRYEIPFDKYSILAYHPVTTEKNDIIHQITNVIDALRKEEQNCVVIYPNNDVGCQFIISEYQRIQENDHFRVFPSIRFEYFLTLLKNAESIIGNSSAGVRESSVYGVPSVDIGTRQSGRYSANVKNIQHVGYDTDEICRAIRQIQGYRIQGKHFGDGNSTNRFLEILSNDDVWKVGLQKRFIEI